MSVSETAGKPSGLRRDAHIIGLLFASTTSMIGSGWLFGAFHASRIAGPLSIWSWVVGAVIIMLIALCFAELAALFPRSGALVHMSHASHGEGLGRIWGWMLFLSYVAVPAVEAEAIVTYANNYLPYFIQPHSSGLLTATGFIVCALLLGVLAVLNLFAVKTLLAVNNAITWWKIAVPVLTVVVLIAASTHWGVWKADPTGYQLSGVFTALPSAGIVFSYLGFRAAIDLGGESANPGRNIPLAVIGSVLLSAVIYILLQVAFLMALQPGNLAQGWSHLDFTGAAGPFAGLAATLGIGWMATLLYVDAFISPGGCGLIYVTGGARILFAVGETNAGPSWLRRLNSAQVPWAAVAVMWVVGVVFLLPFPAWQLMVGYITSITVLTYGLGPIVLMVLRRNQPDLKRSFTLWGANIIAPAAFICSNWVIYWTGFETDSFLFILLLVGFLAYAGYFHLVLHKPASEFGWHYIGWLLPWFGGMWVLSALGDVGGGYGVLGFWPGVVLVGLWSIFIIWLSLRSALPAEDTAQMMIAMEKTR
ncbi:APC family permease [Acidocella aminolytica]|jgi:amino acid transporter|uniref:Amino acid permease n=1 Tax=Acidocella aminolytica 101 = DSM 11237 TaxID=1120923 RepID=A0A0D6PI16_9PROT|nr:APC family permease [Acidocella aminolytica]GAN81297.1 amino acid permease [Acidocella aminolytica 101 = DSM 11237]GBQ34213.1 amino acid transporter [Acidocella aminolytica 101 = DSM 11237]SHE83276.1 amino acid/polyamine/organocation transporter, APC superfamily [Acidocella aminolytica 101 = DSM 11237]